MFTIWSRTLIMFILEAMRLDPTCSDPHHTPTQGLRTMTKSNAQMKKVHRCLVAHHARRVVAMASKRWSAAGMLNELAAHCSTSARTRLLLNHMADHAVGPSDTH